MTDRGRSVARTSTRRRTFSLLCAVFLLAGAWTACSSDSTTPETVDADQAERHQSLTPCEGKTHTVSNADEFMRAMNVATSGDRILLDSSVRSVDLRGERLSIPAGQQLCIESAGAAPAILVGTPGDVLLEARGAKLHLASLTFEGASVSAEGGEFSAERLRFRETVDGALRLHDMTHIALDDLRFAEVSGASCGAMSATMLDGSSSLRLGSISIRNSTGDGPLFCLGSDIPFDWQVEDLSFRNNEIGDAPLLRAVGTTSERGIKALELLDNSSALLEVATGHRSALSIGGATMDRPSHEAAEVRTSVELHRGADLSIVQRLESCRAESCDMNTLREELATSSFERMDPETFQIDPATMDRVRSCNQLASAECVIHGISHSDGNAQVDAELVGGCADTPLFVGPAGRPDLLREVTPGDDSMIQIDLPAFEGVNAYECFVPTQDGAFYTPTLGLYEQFGCRTPYGCDIDAGECDSFEPDGQLCARTDLCAENSYCEDGVCVGGTPAFCQEDPTPGDICRFFECSSVFGCTQIIEDDGTACGGDEGSCLGSGTCVDGYCEPTDGFECPAPENECMTATCVPDEGCVEEPVPNGLECDDGNACTSDTVCSFGECLFGDDVQCPEVTDQCMVAVCDPATGCDAAPVSDGTTCDDGNPCTENSQCGDGTCLPGTEIACESDDPCEAGSCVDGECVFEPVDSPECTDDPEPEPPVCEEVEECKGPLCRWGITCRKKTISIGRFSFNIIICTRYNPGEPECEDADDEDSSSSEGQNCPGNSQKPDGSCPGNSGNAPPAGSNPPGNSGNAPGHNP